MSWEAANIPKPREDYVDRPGDNNDGVAGGMDHSDHQTGGYVAQQTQTQSRSRRRHGMPTVETVEAALSRLSKAYTTSMECIGSIHKMNEMILLKQQQETTVNRNHQQQADNAILVLKRVANAARTTFEKTILLDPLILPYIPTLHQCMIDIASDQILGSDEQDKTTTVQVDGTNKWNIVFEQRSTIPPIIKSAAHKSTLVQLAYLSLVNYSDLLQQICSCQCETSIYIYNNILDRGILPKLKSLISENKHCCWNNEIIQETQRLAVAALCDASNLNYASDPIVWLKLACASRKLERIGMTTQNNESEHYTIMQTHHRRLQRHALQRGLVALPSYMPPNRTILHALQELVEEPEPKEYISKAQNKQQQLVVKTIDLPRYSWSTLGRLLLRACRGEEIVSTGTYPEGHNNNIAAPQLFFGSPKMVVKLSPILILPRKVLGTICQYLENSSIWKFEATCRALSVSIIAARASMHEEEAQEEDGDRRDKGNKERQRQISIGGESETTERESSTSNPMQGERLTTRTTSASSAGAGSINEVVNNITAANGSPPPIPSRQSSRASQRLRSQQISSDKKHEREANRKSFNYCFTAATLSCTRARHDTIVKQLRVKDEYKHLFLGKNTASLSSRVEFSRRGSSRELANMNRREANERMSEASLQDFLTKCNPNNSGPIDVVEYFLVHVSLNVEEVFSSDSITTGTMGLTSCIMSCFQLLLKRKGFQRDLVPKFFQSSAKSGELKRSLQLFALDLLYAELMLLQCDRNIPLIIDFDDDINLVSLMIPTLVESCTELQKELDTEDADVALRRKFLILQTRCYWLTAGFYLYRSQIATEIYISKEAEEEGTWFIGQAIECFGSPYMTSVKSIQTPHLVSPGRQEAYWSEISPYSLKIFRDEIQASSVVSSAREQFHEQLSKWENLINTDEHIIEMSPDDALNLSTIGKKLCERYNTSYADTDSKLTELISNFLSINGATLLSKNSQECKSEDYDDIFSMSSPKVVDLVSMTNPSILSMLVACLNVNHENRFSVAQLLVRLILAARDFHRVLLKQIMDSKLSQKQTDGYNTDDGFSDSDDESQISDEGRDRASKNDDERNVRYCAHIMIFFIDRLLVSFQHILPDAETAQLIASQEFGQMLEAVISFSNNWHQSTLKLLSISEDFADQKLIEITSMLVGFCTSNHSTSKVIERIYFKGMARNIVHHREIFESLAKPHGDRSSRNARQWLCVQRADYISLIASKIG